MALTEGSPDVNYFIIDLFHLLKFAKNMDKNPTEYYIWIDAGVASYREKMPPQNILNIDSSLLPPKRCIILGQTKTIIILQQQFYTISHRTTCECAISGTFSLITRHLSSSVKYTAIYSIIGLSGNEWYINLSGGSLSLGHCNTILSFANTIVYSNIASSQRIQFRNQFDESTLHSSFPKNFFRRYVERLEFIKWNCRIGHALSFTGTI